MNTERRYFFVDEAGNFDFSTRIGASKFFILTSVVMEDCSDAEALLSLRRALVWNGHPLSDAFHATEDKQAVRDQVFDAIASLNIRIDATIIDKSRVAPVWHDKFAFYNLAWRLHAMRVIPIACPPTSELMIVSASFGTRSEQKIIGRAMADVVSQSGRIGSVTKVTYWPAPSDPCLQVADYCCWAIQRKWERDDERSFDLIRHSLATELLFSSESDMDLW